MVDIPRLRVTVITITLNNRSGLERTVGTVRARERHRIELIVIDGKSTDGTRELLESGQLHVDRWISEHDRGIYDAMNKGIAMASGEFICFMNAGDVFDPGVLDQLLGRYDEWNGADIVYGD